LITDSELTAMFPHGAMMISLDGEFFSKVKIGGSQYGSDPDNPDFFDVWLNNYKEMLVHRKVTARDGGIEADASIGKIFLRPLSEDSDA